VIDLKPRIGKRLVRATSMGTVPTLPSGFTGFSLDAANGLSLYSAGVLQARYGAQGGAGVLQSYSGYQPVDATHRCRLRYELPPNAVNSIVATNLSFSLQPFRATTQGTSGASSASSSASGPHKHGVPISDAAGGVTVNYDNASGTLKAVIGIGGGTVNPFTLDDSPSHAHTIAHTHAITAPDGLYDTGCAQGVHVFIDGTDRTSALGGPWGSGSSIDVSDLDITAYITTTGWHEVALSSTSLGVVVAQVSTKAYLKTV
jgi:hypothetical protein